MSRDLVVALSGGIGGAKLALGLSRILPADNLLVVANVGDDFEHLGLHISPDADTLMYTLAGLDNTKLGWGRQDETWSFMETLTALGGEDWFRLGDRDLAVHVERTRRLRQGELCPPSPLRGRPALRRNRAVQRGPLLRHAPKRPDKLLHSLGREFLPVLGAGGAGDALVHQSAAEIVGAGLEARRRSRGPILTQDVWMFAMRGCSASRATACINTASRKVGPRQRRPAGTSALPCARKAMARIQ